MILCQLEGIEQFFTCLGNVNFAFLLRDLNNLLKTSHQDVIETMNICSVFFLFSDYFFIVTEIFIFCFPVILVKIEQICSEYVFEEIRRI